jgi:superfamily II DNA or RNA helicase
MINLINSIILFTKRFFNVNIESLKKTKNLNPKLNQMKSVNYLTNKSSHTPSKEQFKIVNDVLNGKNIIVDAVAGSGKTTTILHIGERLKESNKKILVLTYNKKLEIDTKNKILNLYLNNLISVYTYHSCVCSHFYCKCSNDNELNIVLKKVNRIKKRKNFL